VQLKIERKVVHVWRICFIAFVFANLEETVFCQSLTTPSPAAEQSDALPQNSESRKLNPAVKSGASTSARDASPSGYRTTSFRGKVVWLNEILKEKFGISTVPEAAQQTLALLTDDGELLPILADQRGRAFRTDPRLRQMNVELFVRQYALQPMLQIIRVYELKDGERFEVDYWCDVCAIIMFETGPCACCQDDNRLRKRLIER